MAFGVDHVRAFLVQGAASAVAYLCMDLFERFCGWCQFRWCCSDVTEE
jgi:hypothetical protein